MVPGIIRPHYYTDMKLPVFLLRAGHDTTVVRSGVRYKTPMVRATTPDRLRRLVIICGARLVNASVHCHKIGDAPMRFIFSCLCKGLQSNERPKRVTAKRKNSRHVATIFSLVVAVAFALLLAAAPILTTPIMGSFTEAKYNTYYAPDIIRYYPWDGYYGGAYYYGE